MTDFSTKAFAADKGTSRDSEPSYDGESVKQKAELLRKGAWRKCDSNAPAARPVKPAVRTKSFHVPSRRLFDGGCDRVGVEGKGCKRVLLSSMSVESSDEE